MNLLSQTLNFEVGQIGNQRLLISETLQNGIEEIVKKNISMSKIDWDSFETSWDFKTHPLI